MGQVPGRYPVAGGTKALQSLTCCEVPGMMAESKTLEGWLVK